jgi:hypothetical protein
LPFLAGALLHEAEDSDCGLCLDTAAANGADPELAGFSLQVEETGFGLLGDPCVVSAVLKARDPPAVFLDAREDVEPELAFTLATAKAEELLGGVFERDSG